MVQRSLPLCKLSGFQYRLEVLIRSPLLPNISDVVRIQKLNVVLAMNSELDIKRVLQCGRKTLNQNAKTMQLEAARIKAGLLCYNPQLTDT